MKLHRVKGTTSQTLLVWVPDSGSTTGAGKTGLVHNSAGLTAYYAREGASGATAITLVDMTLGTFTSGGFKELDATNMPGVYQFCPPDAALASGADYVVIVLKGASGMAPVVLEVQLTGVDLDDATAMGVSRLDAAVSSRLASASISLSAGAVTVGTNNDKTGYSLAAAAVQAIWDAATAALTTVGSIGKRLVDNIDAAITSRSTVTTAQVNAEVVDVLTVDTLPELSQAAPAASPTFRTAVMLLYMALRNKLTQTSSQMRIHDDAGTVICKSATSDDGTTFTRDELASGP